MTNKELDREIVRDYESIRAEIAERNAEIIRASTRVADLLSILRLKGSNDAIAALKDEISGIAALNDKIAGRGTK